jgi:predicted HD phosphohydrolase
LVLDIEEKIQIITQHFATAGTSDYIGESVSQVEHALQCAYFAEKSGHSEEVILASLLHDIGHFFSPTEQYQMADLGVVHHEWIGAQLVYALNFSAKIALLIGYHVDAKRYLAAKKPQYYERLSEASKQTLSYQGGPMNQDEMQFFEQLPYFKEILQVRINDEKAKEIDLVVPDLDYYQQKMHQHLESSNLIAGTIDERYQLNDFVNTQWVEQFKEHLLKQ